MGDAFKKVQSGDALRIPAETFNTFIDAARDFKARRQSSSRTPGFDFQQTGIVSVKNASGGDRERFEVLGIDRPIFTPADNLLKKMAGIDKGSHVPNRDKVGTITWEQCREIAETKKSDLNANDLEAGASIIAGTARSMGLVVEK